MRSNNIRTANMPKCNTVAVPFNKYESINRIVIPIADAAIAKFTIRRVSNKVSRNVSCYEL